MWHCIIFSYVFKNIFTLSSCCICKYLYICIERLMSNCMNAIIGLIVVIIIGAVLLGVLSAILQKYPLVGLVLAIIGGIAIGFATSTWWIGVIGGFFIQCILFGIMDAFGHKCVHCGSYDTKVIRKSGSFEAWQCNKCHGVTYKT